jgi:pimeloyl-ACP methyl ester carboxylesterase
VLTARASSAREVYGRNTHDDDMFVEKVWIAMHEALARLSSRGPHRIIKGSGHHIQLDKPQAVIDAVDEVLRQVHDEAKS